MGSKTVQVIFIEGSDKEVVAQFYDYDVFNFCAATLMHVARQRHKLMQTKIDEDNHERIRDEE